VKAEFLTQSVLPNAAGHAAAVHVIDFSTRDTAAETWIRMSFGELED
jgi:hypothetical protein